MKSRMNKASKFEGIHKFKDIQIRKHPNSKASKFEATQIRRHPNSKAFKFESIQIRRHPNSKTSKFEGIQIRRHPRFLVRSKQNQERRKWRMKIKWNECKLLHYSGNNKWQSQRTKIGIWRWLFKKIALIRGEVGTGFVLLGTRGGKIDQWQ